jgi:hypothetical protein
MVKLRKIIPKNSTSLWQYHFLPFSKNEVKQHFTTSASKERNFRQETLDLRWEKVNKTLSQKQGEHGDVLL